MNRINSILSSHRIPIMFGAVALSLILLILVQINWLLTSKKLVEEQFDQQVSLALGSALDKYNNKTGQEISLDAFNTCVGNKECYFFETEAYEVPLDQQKQLAETISAQMSCYGIKEDFTLSLEEKDKFVMGEYLVGEPIISQSCAVEPSLCITFPSRSNYVFDQLIFMIISSILISLLLGFVSFMILKALVKQKRIAENNIDFFNNAAHEFKTPLTNISLALSLFLKKNPSKKGEKYLNIIGRENSKLAKQIEKVLHLSKLENGDCLLEEEILDLRDVVKEAVHYMELIVEEHKAVIEIKLPENPCLIKGDKFHLSKVCINIIENALKYSQEDPRIEISLTQEGQTYKLMFVDNGIGISKVDQEHIFNKFQRVNTGDVQETKGFGIGLAYVKAALDLHKGMINVKSEISKGSQFTISLPANI